MADENVKEEPKEVKRAWIGNNEVGGSGSYEIKESGRDKFLKRGGEWFKVIRGKFGAEEVEGKGKITRDSRNRIVQIGEEKVTGDLELD